MKSKQLIIAFVLTIAFVTCGVPAAPRLIMPGDAEGNDVRAVAVDFLKKIAAGDSLGARTLFSGPADQADILQAEVRLAHSLSGLDKTFKQHFPNTGFSDYTALHRLLQNRLEDTTEAMIILNGDRAFVAGNDLVHSGLVLHSTGAKWTVVEFASDAPTPAAYLNWLAKSIKHIDTVRMDIETGKFKEAADASGTLKSGLEASPSKSRLRQPLPRGMPLPRPRISKDLAPAANKLLGCLGKEIDSPEISATVSCLPGLPRVIEYSPSMVCITSEETGIVLAFINPDRQLARITFSGDGYLGVDPYPGELPFGLKFGQSRRSVEKILGPPLYSSANSESTYIAEYPKMVILYSWADSKSPDNPLGAITTYSHVAAHAGPSTRPALTVPRLEFRLVVEPPADGELLESRDDSDHLAQKLLVDRKILLDENAVAQLSDTFFDTKSRRTRIRLTMTADGARQLEKIRATHAGKKVAIVLDRKILTVQPIGSGTSKEVVIEMVEYARDWDIEGRLHAAINSIPAD